LAQGAVSPGRAPGSHKPVSIQVDPGSLTWVAEVWWKGEEVESCSSGSREQGEVRPGRQGGQEAKERRKETRARLRESEVSESQTRKSESLRVCESASLRERPKQPAHRQKGSLLFVANYQQQSLQHQLSQHALHALHALHTKPKPTYFHAFQLALALTHIFYFLAGLNTRAAPPAHHHDTSAWNLPSRTLLLLSD